jgi:hypothetical protein
MKEGVWEVEGINITICDNLMLELVLRNENEALDESGY